MEVRLDSKDGALVPSPAQVIEQLAARLRSDQQKWLRQLAEEPTRFGDLEVKVHHTFQQLADQVVASLLAQATQQSAALEAAKKK